MRSLLILCFTVFPLSLFAACQNVSWDETARLKQINDGDTVTLEDGRLVRIIGIDTPEINHRSSSQSEPYAEEAKALLERYIAVGDRVHLHFDKQKFDKYGRKLAYLYSKTGRNLALLQLQSGLAAHWVVGKNDLFWRCFQKAEKRARVTKKGIWSNFKPLSAARLSKTDKGYQYIEGRISQVVQTKRGLLITLDRKLKVKISSSALSRFRANNINFFAQNYLLINGKITFQADIPQLTLYHPAQILP